MYLLNRGKAGDRSVEESLQLLIRVLERRGYRQSHLAEEDRTTRDFATKETLRLQVSTFSKNIKMATFLFTQLF